MKTKVEISARHIHLCKDDCIALFGKEDLQIEKNIGQEQFAAQEKVVLVGPKNKISNVRVVGPLRQSSQVEISRSDAIFLGIDAPLKLSGDLPGAEIQIEGPSGTIKITAAIVAKRHMHLSPSEAENLKLKSNDTVSVLVLGDRALAFDNIIIRIDEKFNSSVHIDTDEANAAGLAVCSECELVIN